MLPQRQGAWLCMASCSASVIKYPWVPSYNGWRSMFSNLVALEFLEAAMRQWHGCIRAAAAASGNGSPMKEFQHTGLVGISWCPARGYS